MLKSIFVIGVILIFTWKGFAAEVRNALEVMSFADGFSCNDRFPHHSFCEAVEFRAWSPEEKELVSQYLLHLNDPRLKNLLQTIKTKGITRLHRVGYAATWVNNSQLRRVEFYRKKEKVLLWVDPVTQVIGFTDAFFVGTPFLDPYAKVDRKQLNVLHELIHVYDIARGHASTDPGFYQATGWGWNGKEWALQGVDYERAKRDFQSILEMVKRGRSAEAYALDRELGRAYGFPTLYSMMNSHESFAEAFTYYILDPTAASYMSKELIQYLEKVLAEVP